MRTDSAKNIRIEYCTFDGNTSYGLLINNVFNRSDNVISNVTCRDCKIITNNRPLSYIQVNKADNILLDKVTVPGEVVINNSKCTIANSSIGAIYVNANMTEEDRISVHDCELLKSIFLHSFGTISSMYVEFIKCKIVPTTNVYALFEAPSNWASGLLSFKECLIDSSHITLSNSTKQLLLTKRSLTTFEGCSIVGNAENTHTIFNGTYKNCEFKGIRFLLAVPLDDCIIDMTGLSTSYVINNYDNNANIALKNVTVKSIPDSVRRFLGDNSSINTVTLTNITLDKSLPFTNSTSLPSVNIQNANNVLCDKSKITGSNIGAQIYDTTLGKPLWWNGTAWVDATGATV